MSRNRSYSSCIIIFIIFSLCATVQIYAQEAPVVLDRLEIALWPEYDDPRLLVIYRGELADDPKGSLIFPLSLGAQVHAVAHRGAEGQLLADDWQIFPGSDGQRLLAFAPGSRQFQLEYYEDLTIEGARKSFAFVFHSSRFEIKNFQLEFRQPLGASSLQTTPELQRQGSDAQGFVYFTKKVGSIPPETRFEQTVSYSRTNAEPSVKTPSGTFDFSGWPWQVIGGFFALTIGLVGLLGIWWVRKRSASQKISSNRRAHPKKELPIPSSSSAPSNFCVQCGRLFQPEERFCPQCGTSRG